MRHDIRLVTPMERLICLRTLPLFETLPASDLAILAEHAREVHRSKGAEIFDSDAAAHAIHMVIDGRVRVTRRGKLLRTFGPRDSLGVIALLARMAEGVKAIAETRVLTLAIDAATLLGVMEHHFSILHHVVRATAHELRSELSLVRPDSGARAARSVSFPAPVRPLDRAERLLLVDHSIGFLSGKPTGVGALAQRCRELRVAAGSKLWPPDQPVSAAIVLFDGELSCRSPRNRLEFSVSPTCLVGLVDLLSENVPSYVTIAKTDVRGLAIDREVWLDAFEDHFELAIACLTSLARGLVRALER